MFEGIVLIVMSNTDSNDQAESNDLEEVYNVIKEAGRPQVLLSLNSHVNEFLMRCLHSENEQEVVMLRDWTEARNSWTEAAMIDKKIPEEKVTPICKEMVSTIREVFGPNSKCEDTTRGIAMACCDIIEMIADAATTGDVTDERFGRISKSIVDSMKMM